MALLKSIVIEGVPIRLRILRKWHPGIPQKWHRGIPLKWHSVKVAQKPFQKLGRIFSKPKDRVPKEQQTDSVYIPSLAKTENRYMSDKPDDSLVRIWRSINEQSFVKGKTRLCRNILSKPNIQLCGIIPKLLLPTVGTMNAFVWKLGTQTLPMPLWTVIMEAFWPDTYLHLINKNKRSL